MAKKKRKPDFSKPKPISDEEKLRDELKNSIEKNTDDAPDKENDESDISDSKEERFNGIARRNYEGLPLVVLAGRPNVGKSTLFNRLMQRRLAIVDPTPGVTRDPVEGTAMINGKPVHLVDTGGYKLQRDVGTMEAVLDDLVVERSLEMIAKADIVVLLLEAGQITGEDEDFIQKMRPHWDKLIAVVNKTEGGRNESVAWNYARFGFK